MRQSIELGPFFLHTEWILTGVSLFFSYIIIFHIFFPRDKKQYAPVFSNALFIFIFTYKLSTFVIYPLEAWSDPVAMLALPGSWKEWTVSWLILCIFVYFQSKKNSFSYTIGMIRMTAIYALSLFSFEFFLRIAGFNEEIGSVFYMSIHGISFWILLYIRSLRYLSLLTILFGVASGILHVIYPIETFFVYLPEELFYFLAFLGTIGLLITFFNKGGKST